MNNLRPDTVITFGDFITHLNEGNTFKKDLGIIGPFSDWGYKIKGCCQEKGGIPSGKEILISENSDDLCLKYIYGDNKESDILSIPKHSFIMGGSPQNPVIQTKPRIRWWDEEKNQDDLDEFINSFIESRYFKIPESDISGDAMFLSDILELDSAIKSCEKKKDNHWKIVFDDGYEMNWRKKDSSNFLSNLKFFLGDNSYTPEIEICYEPGGYEAIFNTPKGKFSRKCPKITDLVKDPINNYLLQSSLKRDLSLYQEPVLNYLNSVLKSHDWRPQDKKNLDSFNQRESEINQLKKILSNSLSESDLDEIYSSARISYSPSSSK